MIKCKVCGEEINYEVKFCPQCGAAIEPKNVKQYSNKEKNNTPPNIHGTQKNQKVKNSFI